MPQIYGTINMDGVAEELVAALTAACDTSFPEVEAAIREATALHLEELHGLFIEAGQTPDVFWERLSRERVRERERQRPGQGEAPILRWTDTLLNSLTPGEPGHYEDWQQDGLNYGTEVSYAANHQILGVSSDGRPMPLRQFMFLPTPPTAAAMADLIGEGVAAAFESAIQGAQFGEGLGDLGTVNAVQMNLFGFYDAT